MALIHYPVLNKHGEIIHSAVTSIDLHDLSRTAKTYDISSCYVVTPLVDQKQLVKRICGHWIEGAGGGYNPKRKKALELIHLKDTLADCVNDIAADQGVSPKTVATCARQCAGSIGYRELKPKIKTKKPYLLMFGTAWGLAESIITGADYILEPVCGMTAYNHLSVRSASAVIIDRLVGMY
jgi:hypothetical protein